MISISLDKICSDRREKRKLYGSLRNLFPLISQINQEITALNKICGTEIKFKIQICNNLTVEVNNA